MILDALPTKELCSVDKTTLYFWNMIDDVFFARAVD